MNRKKWFIYAFILALIVIIGGTAQMIWIRTSEVKEKRSEALNLVILDSGDYYHIDDGIDAGLKMAINNLESKYGMKVELSVVDDEGDYVKGIALAKSLAADPDVDVVMSFQNFDSIGPEVPFFEEAKKPFIVTMGCFDQVAESGYEYFIADFISGKGIGRQIGENLKKMGAKNIALCHSDTEFEQDEIRGLQSRIGQDEGLNVVHTQTGPFQKSELAKLILKCRQLDIDTVVANFYNQEDCAWLLGKLAESGLKLKLVGDYAIDSQDILKQYGENLEGVSIIPIYPFTASDALDRFTEDYESTTGLDFTTAALQYYDLMNMIGVYWQVTGGNTSEIMKLVKMKEGYDGIGGNIRFDKNGCLSVKDVQVYVCRSGKFVPAE